MKLYDPSKLTVLSFDSGPEHTALSAAQFERDTGRPDLLLGVKVEARRRAIIGALDRLAGEHGCGLHHVDAVAVEIPKGFTGSRFNTTPVIETSHVAGGLDWHFQNYGFEPLLLSVTAWRRDMMNGIALVTDAMVARAVADVLPPPVTSVCVLCDGRAQNQRTGRFRGRWKKCPVCRGSGATTVEQPQTNEHVRDAFGLGCVAAWRALGVRPDFSAEAWADIEALGRQARDKATEKAKATRSRNKSAKEREADELRGEQLRDQLDDARRDDLEASRA